MKKVMISQPMRGLTEEEIKQKKDEVVKYLESNGYEIVNSLFEDDWAKNEILKSNGIKQIPVYFLCKSLEVMAQCDTVYFCKGWNETRGCIIEHEVAERYGLEVIEEK